MALLALITGGYLLAIGLGWHTPRMRRQISAAALAKLRLWGKVAGVASLLLAVFYLMATFALVNS
ncbi:MAG: hypothetical protein ABW049_02215 [Spongiibacteraceae bacterium]